MRNVQGHCIKTSSNIFFGYLLESPRWGDSYKYPKHTFYEKMIIKQDLSYISFCPLRPLFYRKFLFKATSLGTNGVIVTKVHCTSCKEDKYILKRIYPLEPWTDSLDTVLAVLLEYEGPAKSSVMKRLPWFYSRYILKCFTALKWCVE